MSAYQNSLVPPEQKRDKQKVTLGREVFERAGCISCHSGRALTNNRITPVEEAKTQPSRAKALEDTEKFFAESYLYTPDTLDLCQESRHPNNRINLLCYLFFTLQSIDDRVDASSPNRLTPPLDHLVDG